MTATREEASSIIWTMGEVEMIVYCSSREAGVRLVGSVKCEVHRDGGGRRADDLKTSMGRMDTRLVR